MKSITEIQDKLIRLLKRRLPGKRSRRPRSAAQIEMLEQRTLLAGTTGGLPSVTISKALVESTDPTATFDAPTGPAGVAFSEPGSLDSPFTGLINSNLVRTGTSPAPLDANLTNANPGDTVRFAILLENTSTAGGAFDVAFRDTLPAGLTYVSNSLTLVNGAGTALGYQELAASTDGSALFTTGIQLDDPGVTSGTFSTPNHCGALDALSTGLTGQNIAIAFYDATVLNTAGNIATLNSSATLTSFSQTEGGANLGISASDPATVTLERIDLEVTKSVSNPSPIVGDIVTWTISVANNAANATSAATGIIVDDAIPSGQTIVANSAVMPAGGTFDESTGRWTVGNSINPGDSVQLTFQTVAGNSVAFASSVVDVEVNGQLATTTVTEGGSVQYTVSVTNNAEAATTNATGVTVADLLPTGLTFVSGTASAGTFTSGTGTWDLSSTALAPGQTETLTISATVAAGLAGTTLSIAAELATLNETDVDSVAANASAAEDDDYTQAILVQAAATTRTVSGRVFLDVDNDGIDDAETGVSTVTVNAYGPDGTLSGTTTTDATGNYSIAGVTSEAVRLEFVNFTNAQSTTTAQTPPASSTTFSSLAFLTAGTSSLTANLAMYQPAEKAQFVTTCFVYSGQSTLDPTVEPAVIAFYADGTLKTTLATISEVGATNGLAVHSFSGDRFVAAFQKRHADIGPAGNSAIYRIDSAGNVSTFIRLDDFFGADSTGPYSHNPLDWFTDTPAFSTTGKVSLGDVDISEDGQFLYTINLATRELIQIPIGSGGTNTPVDYLPGDTRTINTFPILGDDTALPTNGGVATGLLGVDPTANIRPFALAVKDGLVYTGMVNSAESTAIDADLNAYVFTFNPATAQFNSTASASFDLDSRVTGGGWQSWTSDWNELPKFYEAAGDFFTTGRNQPWLTDIEFDNNGDMILGFRDRTGDEAGHMVGDPTGADTDGIGGPDRFYHDTKGEILRLRQATSTTWQVESAHLAGDGTEYYEGDAAEFEAIASTLHPEAAQGGLTLIPGFTDVTTTAIDPQSFWAGGIISLDNATGAQTDQLDIYSGSEAVGIVTFGKSNGLGDLEYANNLSIEIGNRIWVDADKDGIQDAGELPLANIDLQLFDVSDPAAPILVGNTITSARGEFYFNDSNISYTDGSDPVGLRALTDYEVRVASAEFAPGGTLDQFLVTRQNNSPTLVARTTQPVTGAAEFDTDFDLTADTARNQRFDVLTPTGLSADGVRVIITNATGGFATVSENQTVVFEFADGSIAGSFEYTIIDDRIDSDATGFDDDADGVTDRAVVAFTSGAAGSTDHSLDFGFFKGNVDLELSKLSERKLTVEGEVVTFFVSLTNNGLTANLAATGVTVADVIPAGLTFVSGSVVTSQGAFNGSAWTLPTPINPGDTATLSYQATVDAGTANTILINSAQVATLNQTDFDSLPGNDDGDRSEDDEDDAVLLVGTITSTTTFNTAQVTAANEPDFDSTPGNNDLDESEDDEASATYTLSSLTNIFDFGDLPDIYQTLSASGGPSHRRGTPTFLGTAVDDETDGQPSPTAIADGSDDDGIRFLTPLIPGTSVSIEVNASTDGFLNAWIDFNADGVLDELSITTIDGTTLSTSVAANDLALTAGLHVLSVAVPATATGLMAARFRYTSDQMATLRAPGGPWLNGEVEDYMLRQIGDQVWFDHDADGVLDAVTEAGLAGVTVVLSTDLDGDGSIETYATTTDANGFYRFDGVPEGAYTVTVTPPGSVVATFDPDAGNDSTTAVTVGSTTTTQFDVDFGYRGIGVIGDTVWVDTNANGTIDTGESGIPGAAVQVTGDINGDSIVDVTHTTTTNAAGVYEFLNMVPGNYTITVTPPAGSTPTFDADNISTPNTSNVSLSVGSSNLSQDFGYRGTASIGDTVWVDIDGDGVKDTGEPPIAGASIQLTGDTNGDSVIDVTLNTTTSAAGVYGFANLLPGNYTVTVTPPTGYVQTFDSNGIATPNTSTVTLAAGTASLDQDFGYRGSGLIGDTVWTDTNGNGVIDTGESAIAAVNVQLVGDLNADTIPDVSLTTTTNASGVYEFANLPPGTYVVAATQPAGTTATFDGDGIATPNSSIVTLAAGATDRSQNFGYRTSTGSGTGGLIGDTIWFDTDGDGIQDIGEPALGGVPVQLNGDTNGDSVVDVTLNTTTSTTGLYEFSNLLPGNYTVTVTPPAGLSPTFDADGIASASTTAVTLTSGQTIRTLDFGYTGTSLIGDRVWFDADKDGIQDAGEVGIPGISVQLTGDINGDSISDVTLNTVTDASGNYEFPSLAAGTYTMTVTPLSGSVPTADADGIATPQSSTLTLAAGTINRDQDFGYAGTATIGDLIFNDVDNSISQSTGDTGLPGVDVVLQLDINNDTIVDFTQTATTDASGSYTFTDLLPGTYTVSVSPTGFTGANSPVVDPDGTNDGTTLVTLTPGSTNLNLDFGYPGTTTPPTSVDLSINKDNSNSDDVAAEGSLVTYSITVSNAGPADAVNASVTDTLPSQFISNTWTATGSAGSTFVAAGTGNLAETVSIPAGGTVIYTVVAQLADTFTGSVTNTATVTTTQPETDLTNNTSTDVTTVTPLTLTPENDALPGQPFQIGARGMSHVALVPFVVGTTPGTGVINGVTVDIADPQVFMVGFVCVDDRIIGVYNIPADFDGQTLYFQSYESSPTPRVSNLITANVGGARLVVSETAGVSSVTEGSTTDTVSVTLSEAPATNVTLDVQNQNPNRLAVAATSLTFTPTDWNVPQTVSIAAVEDSLVNGDVKAEVAFSVAAGSDSAYDNTFSKTIEVEVTDNDVLQKPGFTNSHTSTANQQPAITWSAVAGADSYDLWISPATDISNATYNVNVIGTSFTPPADLSIGRHAVWVRARTVSGQTSGWSAGASIDITTAPVVTATTPGTDNRSTISWNAVEGAVRYEVWANNTTSGESKVAYNASQTTTSFTTDTLAFGVHAVWVRAINQFGQAGSWSTAANFFVGPVLTGPISTFNQQPEFTWISPGGAASFEIYLRSGTDIIQQAGITTTSFTPLRLLNNNTTYRWWVRGYTANGKAGRWAGPAEAFIGGRPVISSPTEASTTSATPIFNWTTVSGAATYDLFVSRLDVPGLAIRNTTLTANTYTPTTALTPGTYRTWVRSISTSGTASPWSVAVTFVVS